MLGTKNNNSAKLLWLAVFVASLFWLGYVPAALAADQQRGASAPLDCSNPYPVADEAELNAAIVCFNAQTSGSYAISITADITLTANTTTIDNDSAATLTVYGNDNIIDADYDYVPFHNISSDITFIQISLVNGYSDIEGGGAIYSEGGHLTVIDSYFYENDAAEADLGGGAILSMGPLDVTGSTFTQNYADGAGLFADRVGSGGGAIYVASAVTISDTNFYTNTAYGAVGGGGAIYALTTVTVNNSRFHGNGANGAGAVSGECDGFCERTISATAGSGGGAIYAHGATDITMTDFMRNTADESLNGGGAIYASSSVTISNTDFYTNTANNAQSGGGAIYGSGTITVQNSGFYGNNADDAGISIGDCDGICGRSGSASVTGGGGGAIYTDGATSISMTHFISNTANGSLSGGGAIYTTEGAELTVYDSLFNTNDALEAGSFFFFLRDATDTTVGGGGGAIYAQGTTTIAQSEFLNNLADASLSGGGAIYATAETTVTDSSFEDNYADNTGFGGLLIPFRDSGNGGGAIYSSDSLTVNRSEFHYNGASQGVTFDCECPERTAEASTSGNGGGAIYARGHLDVDSSTFVDNFAEGVSEEVIFVGSGGGAIYYAESDTDLMVVVPTRATSDNHSGATIDNSLFERNSADESGSGGGAIYVRGVMAIANSTFISNQAISVTTRSTGGGGAIYANTTAMTQTEVAITNSLFYSNTADNGGAVYSLSSSVSITNSAVVSNTAVESGGGLYGRESSNFAVVGTTIADNTANTVRGGGLYIREGSTAHVSNSTLSGNSAAGLAGTADDAGNGGGVYIGASVANYVTFNNVTITDNDAAGNGGGIDFNRLDSSDQLTLTNTIVAGNSDTGGYPDCYDNGTTGYTLTLDGNNLFGGATGDICAGAAGASDFSLNTLDMTIDNVLSGLADNDSEIAAGSSLTDTLRVQTHALVENSPALDAGHNDTCVSNIDQRGFPRPVDHDGDGAIICDIGAFEAGQAIFKIYLPLVMTPPPSTSPDLIVESVTLSASDVQVVIKNQGTGATTTNFWVDLYIAPDAPPAKVNETWEVQGGEGIVWGLVDVSVGVGESVTLTLSSTHFNTTHSNFSGNIAADAQMYAHVDAANTGTSYGNVLESHEILGGAYNNILAQTADIAVSASVVADRQSVAERLEALAQALPSR